MVPWLTLCRLLCNTSRSSPQAYSRPGLSSCVEMSRQNICTSVHSSRCAPCTFTRSFRSPWLAHQLLRVSSALITWHIYLSLTEDGPQSVYVQQQGRTRPTTRWTSPCQSAQNAARYIKVLILYTLHTCDALSSEYAGVCTGPAAQRQLQAKGRKRRSCSLRVMGCSFSTHSPAERKPSSRKSLQQGRS